MSDLENLFVKASGSWRDVEQAYIKISGSWREVTPWMKISGSWRKVNLKNYFVYSSPNFSRNSTGEIFAADQEGNLVWTYFGDDWVYRDITVDNERNIYALSSNSYRAKINSQGEREWKEEISDPGSSISIDDSGNMYIGFSSSARVRKLDSNRNSIWSNALHFNSSAVSVKYHRSGYVYVGTTENRIHKLDASTGDEIWKTNTGVFELGAMDVALNGDVYTANFRNFRRINASGNEVWSEIVSQNVSRVFVHGNLIYLKVGDFVQVYNTFGSLVSSHEITSARFESITVDPDGNVFIGTSGGVSKLDSNMNPIWRIGSANRVVFNLVTDPGHAAVF